MKRIALFACLALAVVVPAQIGISTTPASASAPMQAGHTCQNIEIMIRPHSSNGAAGHVSLSYQIHNLSGQPCTLYGYPGVQLMSRQFATLPTTVHRGGFLARIPKTLVHVGAHGNAYFTLVYTDVQTASQPCYKAFYLLIIAPNDFLPVVTYATASGGSILACSGTLDVSPVTAQPRYF